MRLEDIEALEGADLRQLQLYLSGKDKGRVLGDLFRICTPEGHVKWVCIDHYNENYRKAVMQRFKDVITANGGSFYSWLVIIRLGSAIVAKQFYEALVVARGIESLDITLKWDVTLDDLRMLASAVTKANIIYLTMNGEHFKGPVLDMINSGYRYDPILVMMSNGRIQSMSLKNFDNLFQKMDIHSMRMTSRLRYLTLASELRSYTRLFKSTMTKLFECCPSLVKLDIRVFNLHDAFEDLTTMLPILPCLEELIVRKGEYTLTNDEVVIKVFQSKIQAVEAIIWRLDDLSSDSLLLLRKGRLTELKIRSSSVESCVSQLSDTIHWNTRLRNIVLECDVYHSQAIMVAITSTREEILSGGSLCDLQQLKIYLNGGDVSIVVEFQD
ncbi:hypothetical protein BGZ65_011056, partial [Modicella reniformis]